MVGEIYAAPNGTIWGLDSYMNYVVGVEPLFFPVILAVIWIIVLVATKSYSTSRAFTYASFVAFILSVPIVILGWMANRYMYLALIMTAAGIIYIRFWDSYY